MSRRGEAGDLGSEARPVRLRVFGGIRAERTTPGDREAGAGELNLGGRQERTLLALLVVHRRTPLSGERLVDMLWPGDAPRTAAKVVQVYIGRLRAELGQDAIDRSGDGYRLTEVIGVATDSFERAVAEGLTAAGRDPLVALDRLNRALAEADGDPFATEDPLDELVVVASRLVELRWQAREARIELLLGLRRVGQVLAEVPGYVAAEPIRESMWLAWMCALAMTGRQAEALATFDAAAAALDEQLGIEPGATLVELRERITRNEPVVGAATAAPFVRTLPPQSTPFVGRRADLDELGGRLRPGGSRLVTVTGAGGTGKTRLVIEVADRLADSFDGAVAYVDLASVRGHEQLWPAVWSVIGDSAGGARLPGAGGALGAARCLLVLDNPERVRGADGAIAEVLVDAPGLQVLVASRILVHVAGEEAVDLQPLDRGDAAALFELRADAAGAPPESRPIVDAICERLDRLPLAIELAALQARAMPGSELVRALERRIPVLVGGTDDGADRHRTIEATIAWSYDLLPSGARRMFERLAVFEGGCTVPAAIAVCDARFDDLRTLVDHSLVRRIGDRMTMLDTIHEFAAARLDESGERAELLERHAAWYLEQARHEQATVPAERQYRLLEDDVANQRIAMATLCAETPTDRALDLAMILWMSWIAAGRVAEGDAWFEAAVARDSRGEPPAWALTIWGEFARSAGDLDRAEALKLAAVDRLRIDGEDRELAPTLTDLAEIARLKGDLELARRRAQEALDIRTRAGKPDGVVHAIEALAAVEIDEGNLDTAAKLLEQGMAYVRDVGPMSRTAGHFSTYVPLDLAHVRVLQGDLDAARELIVEGLDAAQRLGLADAVAFGLEVAAGFLERAGDLESVAVLLGASAEVRMTSGMIRWSGHEVDRVEAALVSGLGEEDARSLRLEGATMPRDSVVRLALDRVAGRSST